MDNLFLKNMLIQKLFEIKETKFKNWEGVAKALYQALGDTDIAEDICKENINEFQSMVLKLQAKKNELMHSSTGNIVEDSEPFQKDEGMIRFASKTADFNSRIWKELNTELKAVGIVPLMRPARPMMYELSAFVVPQEDADEFKALSDKLGAGYEISEAKYEAIQEASRKRYFHISKTDLGTKVKFKPRIPSCSSWEPRVPRICVSPTVEGCLTALCGVGFSKEQDIFVYELQGNPKIVKAKDISDSSITGEKWVVETSVFKKVGEISFLDIPYVLRRRLFTLQAGSDNRKTLEAQKKLKSDLKPYIDEFALVESEEETKEDIPIYFPPMNFDKARVKSKLKEYKIKIEKNLVNYALEESLVDHARNELKLAGLFEEDSDYNGMLGEAVMQLMEVFAKQGHSGFSAVLTTDLFNKLSKYNTLTELTNNPEEWVDLRTSFLEGDVAGMEYQSKRNPSCFSTDGGKTYYDLNEMEEIVDEETGEVIRPSRSWENKIIHNSVEYKN